jgi:hypothetical protein
MHFFHTYPVVGDEFPSRIEPGGGSRLLPLIDAIGPDLIEGREFGHGPVRAVFLGLNHGTQYNQGRGIGKNGFLEDWWKISKNPAFLACQVGEGA